NLNHQRLRSGHRRARNDRQEARRRRSAAGKIARALRARRPAVAVLPHAARRSREADRDFERARRSPAGGRHFLERRRSEMTQVASLAGYLEARRAQIDAALDQYLPAPPACPQGLYDAMRYSLRAGGKRLRPILTLASAETVGSGAGSAAAGSA